MRPLPTPARAHRPHQDRPHLVSAPAERFFGYYPGVVAVVTAAHGERRNVLSAGWHTALSASPPLYGVAVAPERFSHGLILKSLAFAVQFLPFAHAEAIAGAGSLSAHELGNGVGDKLERLSLAWHPGASTAAPILHDAYLAYECRLEKRVRTGDHDFLVGEVLAVHHRPEAFDERFVQRAETVPGAVYYGRSSYEALGAGRRAEFPPEVFRTRLEDD